jgi:hypothetical protein
VVFGFSAMQANNPDISLFVNSTARLPVRWVGLLGYSKELGLLRLSNLTTVQHQLDITTVSSKLTGQWKFIKMGIGGRTGSGNHSGGNWLMSSAGLQFDKFTISYNRDYFNSKSLNLSSHEISAALYIKGLKKEDNISAFVNSIL